VKFFTSDRVAKMLNQVANQLLHIPGSTSTNGAESLNNQVKDGVSHPPVLATVTAHQFDMRLALEVFMVNSGGQRVLRANSPTMRMLASAGRGKEILELGSDPQALSSPASAIIIAGTSISRLLSLQKAIGVRKVNPAVCTSVSSPKKKGSC